MQNFARLYIIKRKKERENFYEVEIFQRIISNFANTIPKIRKE